MKNRTSAQATENMQKSTLKRRHDDWNIFQTITSLKGLNREKEDREGEEDDLGCFI